MTDPVKTGALLVGLPFTGKTTYLALLYLAILQGKAGPITLGGYQDDREFVNEIAQRLHRCEEAEHTEIEERRAFALSLDLEGDPTFLYIPDLSGETWKHALEDREWTVELDERVRHAVGYIIFVHANDFVPGDSIAAVEAAADGLDGPEVPGDESGDANALDGPEVPGDESGDANAGRTEGVVPAGSLAADQPAADAPALAQPARRQPTQVSLVDFLQLLCEERQERPARVSIVVSAWDLTGNVMSPEQWLGVNCHLVDQYLQANRGWLDAGIWGISAQGGSFKTEIDRLIEENPVDRARVYRADGSSGSCEEPLLWILRGQSE